MSQALQQSSPPAPHLAEVKPLTFADHVTNIFRLVIKELSASSPHGLHGFCNSSTYTCIIGTK